MNEKKKSNWLLWVLLVFLPPIGIIYMWVSKKEFTSKKKIVLTIVFALWFIICLAINGSSGRNSKQDNSTSTTIPVTETQADTTTLSNTSSTEPETNTTVPETDSASTTTSDSETDTTVSTESAAQTTALSMGQSNALGKAAEYLSISAFSYSGLISQLEYEGFSTEDATYAADNCGADWNEQAATKAQEYLAISSFSKDSLIQQLEYEGFSSDQANYGVSAVGY